MVDHFLKYAWRDQFLTKKTITVIKALKTFWTTFNQTETIQSNNGGEFSSRVLKQFLLKNSLKQKFEPPYCPK